MTDLRDKLTVFMITTGQPSTSDCVAHLHGQDCRFRLKTIANTAPIWRAFQRMLDECETPFFAQVDADMLLNADAVRTLYESIAAAHESVAFVSGWLWDDDVGRPIHGCKAYRHAVCARYPYRESVSCEVDQFQRMQQDGITYYELGGPQVAEREKCVGLHYASQTPRMAFDRWKRMFQKFRVSDQVGWIAPYLPRFLERWRATGNDVDLWRLLGAVAGLCGPAPEQQEIDYRRPDQDYRRLASLIGEYAKGPQEVSLYLTDRCNFRCVFDGNPCKREADPAAGAGAGVPHSGDMELWRLRDVLDRFPTIRGACVAGFGEPLLHPGLAELVALLRERDVFVGIITNGSVLELRAEALGKMGLGYLSVSLNAVTPGQHEAITRTKTWERVLRGIRRMAEGPVRTGISYVVTRENVQDVRAMLALGKELGAKFINLVNVLPHVSPLTDRFRETVITTQSTDALRVLEEARTAPGAELVGVWPEPVDLEAGPPLRCMSPFVSLGFDAMGWITPCRRVDAPSESYGGIYWPDLWQSPSFWRSRLELVGDRPLPDKCRGCFGNWKE